MLCDADDSRTGLKEPFAKNKANTKKAPIGAFFFKRKTILFKPNRIRTCLLKQNLFVAERFNIF